MNEKKYNKNYYKFNDQDRDRIGNLFYSNIIKRNFKVESYLDFGCGVGFLLKKIEKIKSIKTTAGYEINDFAINNCKINTIRSKIFNKLEVIEEKFDLISMIHVVEHIKNDELILLLKQLKKILNKKGKILISTPAKYGLAHNLKNNKWIGFKDPTHINLKSFEDWRMFFINQNFTIIKSSNDGLWDFPYGKILFKLKFYKIVCSMIIQIFMGYLLLKNNEGETLILIIENNE